LNLLKNSRQIFRSFPPRPRAKRQKGDIFNAMPLF